MATRVTLPLMGEGIIEAQISRWLKEVGQMVKRGEPLVEVETDKVTTELIAETNGLLSEITVPAGEMAKVDQQLAIILEADVEAVEVARNRSREAKYSGRVSPVVARMVKEHRVNLDQVVGSGQNGRITKRDVLDHLMRQPSAPTVPSPPVMGSSEHVTPTQPPTAAQPNGTLIPLSNMRRAIADHMVLSKSESPHATTVFEVDFHAVAKDRSERKDEFAQRGVKLTYMAYIASAIVQGLQAVPTVNSQWTAGGIRLHPSINLGIATAIENGLVVPVVGNAETLNLFGIAQSIERLSKKARNNQIQPADLQSGTFTVTNHGVFGSLFGTPIINQPQCGILGIGVIEERVCVIEGMIAIRPKAYFSFSFDHRILDGADADRFMQVVKQSIENWATP